MDIQQPSPAPENVYSARLLGLIGDNDSVDNAPLFQRHVNTISSRGGGVVDLGPRKYRMLTRLDVPANVSVRGVRGQTKLDFSGLPAWENSVTNGLIRAQGSIGTPVALARGTRSITTMQMRITAAARSGTIVTATSDIPHGLGVGDPVWISGSPTSSQAVFFTVNQASGDLVTARTTPAIVASVVDTTHFTYTVPNTGDTTLSTFAYANFASDVILVASNAGFSADQDVMIRSQAYRSDGMAEQCHIGEFGKIARLISTNMILLQSDTQDVYAVADTAQIVPVAFQRGFIVENVEIIGKGPNTGSGPGDRAIMAYLCENPRVEGCTFTNVDQMATNIWSCLGGSVRNNLIVFNEADESGWSSGGSDIQYGVGYGGCTTGLEISYNTIIGGRHGIVQTMTGDATYHGVSRNISITNNTLLGQWLSAICTHQGVDKLVITGNTINGAEGGINPRYCRELIVSKNVIRAYDYGVAPFGHIGNVTVEGNSIKAGQYAIRLGPTFDGEVFGPVKILGNNCEGGEYGIYVADVLTGMVAAIDIDISGNTLKGTKYEAIRVSLGSDAVAGDGWYGKINNNTIIDAGLGGSRNGVWLSNFRGGQANDNTFKGSTQLVSAFLIAGAGSGLGLQFMDNWIAPGLLSSRVFTFSSAAGAWLIRTNLPPTTLSDEVCVIASGLVVPNIDRGLVTVEAETFATLPSTGDQLDGLPAGYIGQTVMIRPTSNARAITVADNQSVSGGYLPFQLNGSSSRTLSTTKDGLTVWCDGVSWNERAFSNN